MARRSPTNQRYQKDATHGKTRKSASSAKPIRDRRADATPAKPSPSRVLHPPTEEYRKARRIWWVLLFTSVVLITVSFAIQGPLADRIPRAQTVWAVLVGIAYAAMFGAIAFDFTRLRTLRREYTESTEAGTKNKS